MRSVLQPLAAEPEPQSRVQQRISPASSVSSVGTTASDLERQAAQQRAADVSLRQSLNRATRAIQGLSGGGAKGQPEEPLLTASSLDRQFAGDTQAIQEQTAEEARIATREIEALTPQPEPAPEPTRSPTVQPRILRGDPEQTERFGEFATPEEVSRRLGGQRKVSPQRESDVDEISAVAQQEATAPTRAPLTSNALERRAYQEYQKQSADTDSDSD